MGRKDPGWISSSVIHTKTDGEHEKILVSNGDDVLERNIDITVLKKQIDDNTKTPPPDEDDRDPNNEDDGDEDPNFNENDIPDSYACVLVNTQAYGEHPNRVDLNGDKEYQRTYISSRSDDIAVLSKGRNFIGILSSHSLTFRAYLFFSKLQGVSACFPISSSQGYHRCKRKALISNGLVARIPVPDKDKNGEKNSGLISSSVICTEAKGEQSHIHISMSLSKGYNGGASSYCYCSILLHLFLVAGSFKTSVAFVPQRSLLKSLRFGLQSDANNYRIPWVQTPVSPLRAIPNKIFGTIEWSDVLYDDTSTAFDAWEWTNGMGAPSALIAAAVLVTLSETRQETAPSRQDKQWIRFIKLLMRFLLLSSFALEVSSIFVSNVTGSMLLGKGPQMAEKLVGYGSPLQLLRHHHE